MTLQSGSRLPDICSPAVAQNLTIVLRRRRCHRPSVADITDAEKERSNHWGLYMREKVSHPHNPGAFRERSACGNTGMNEGRTGWGNLDVLGAGVRGNL